MRSLDRWTMAVTAALGVSAAGQAEAHPHVFAEARLEVVVSADGTVKKLRHLWRFDDLFSSTVLVEFDKDGDLKLDAEELKDVSNTIFKSLAEYNYFQMVTQNGKDVAMAAPKELIADFQDQRLIIMFEDAPKAPLRLAGKTAFGVYDPTFYTAIDFVDDAKLEVKPLPQGCVRSVVRPDPDQALAQNQSTLTDAFFNDPAGTNMSKIFATRLELDCTGQG